MQTGFYSQDEVRAKAAENKDMMGDRLDEIL